MRGKRAKIRKVTPDPKYGSILISKFINNMMQDGRKETSTSIIYEALELLEKETKLGALEAFDTAMDNIQPKVEVRSRRVGGANYQVPVPVTERRQQALAFRWIIDSARKSRKNTSTGIALGRVLIDAVNKEGAAYKKREDTHRMAEANKAFAQFAW